ncbi:MAG: formylmethanofuran--tetrahydromethanopterin formyltransferase [Pirellulaceae bacterium]|nr:MAG: formylmethanofuran--tetrahydromethanopterin formyltransferase [Pirellulaceae bacterium]
MPQAPQVDDTFAEAFPMTATRLIITALDEELARVAAHEFCGNASSVIGCDAEAGMETTIDSNGTPDGRPGVSVLVFAFSRDRLEEAVTARVGQNVLTCPTTACYAGLPVEDNKQRIRLGGRIRFFGDGFQSSKLIGDRRLWRIPVMDGEFLCDDVVGVRPGIGGGNLLITAVDQPCGLAAARAAAEAMRNVGDCILPFPAGIVRSGSKVGSKYQGLPASTNDPWCPTLRGQTNTQLREHEHCIYEIVIDGLSERAVARAMRAGMNAACQVQGVVRISAGNYGGKLGKYHFHLHRLEQYERDGDGNVD